MEDCIFCKIANKEITAQVVFEDDDFIAFLDINPKAKTHILLIPKKHIVSIAELEDADQDLMGKMIMRAKEVASKAGLTSFRVVSNSGADSGQEVPHLHFHILGGNQLGDIA